jgi:hypothetical protein
MTLQEFYSNLRPLYTKAIGTNLLPHEFNTLIKKVNLVKWEKERVVFEEDQRNMDAVQWLKSEITTLTLTTGKATLPTDYGTKVYCYIGTGTTTIDVEIVQEDTLASLQRNTLYPPSVTEPVGVLRGGYLCVYPTTVTSVYLIYLKKPMPATTSPVYAGTEPVYVYKEGTSGIAEYDPTNSVQFGWPDTEFVDLLNIAINELGINKLQKQ